GRRRRRRGARGAAPSRRGTASGCGGRCGSRAIGRGGEREGARGARRTDEDTHASEHATAGVVASTASPSPDLCRNPRSPELPNRPIPMKLHEYQAKDILAKYGVAVQRGEVAETVEEAVAAAEKMAADGVSLFVVKAQIHAGGRGKGGGVKLAKSVEEVREKAEAILGMQLKTPQTGPEGQLVRKVLVTA